LVVSFVVASTGACGGSKQEAKSPGGEGGDSAGPAEVGKQAPDLSLQTLNNKGKIDNSSLSGKVVVVDFWATWCGPCKESFPALEEIQKAGKAEVVGISVDDSKDGVLEFAKEHGATFAIGWDEGHTIANRWKVGTMPTTYILDSSGKVRYIHAGYHNGEKEEIRKEIATLADESPGSGGSKAAKSEPKSDSSSSSSSSSSDEPPKSAGASASASSDEAAEPADPPPAKPAGKKAPPKKAPGKKAPGKKKKPGT